MPTCGPPRSGVHDIHRRRLGMTRDMLSRCLLAAYVPIVLSCGSHSDGS